MAALDGEGNRADRGVAAGVLSPASVSAPPAKREEL
jgi:hypothetical protein